MDGLLQAFSGALRLIASGDPSLGAIVRLSLEVSLAAVACATLLALPLGAAIAVGRFPGRRAVVVLLNALMGLPPVVVGLFVYLMLSRAGEPKVGDFGASLQQRPGWATTQVSSIGSPAYMSPEQLRMEPPTHQTDIYSLGATLYRLLTGRTPFAAASPSALAYAILNATPPPPSTHRPGLPPAVDALVLKALEKDPRERHLTWQEFIDDLSHATRALSPGPLSWASSGL